MNVYIKSVDNKYPLTHNMASGAIGFKSLGFSIKLYNNINDIKLNNGDAIITNINDFYKLFKINNINVLNIDYPKCFNKYYGRNINIYRLNEYNGNYPVFVKPVKTKLFKALVVDAKYELDNLTSIYSDELCYFQDVIDIKAEWRVFIYYNEILGIYRDTDDSYSYDYNFITGVLGDALGLPNAYSIDVGLTSENKMIVVEVNDGFAIGRYGLSNINYAKFLYARTCEIFNYKDILREGR